MEGEGRRVGLSHYQCTDYRVTQREWRQGCIATYLHPIFYRYLHICISTTLAVEKFSVCEVLCKKVAVKCVLSPGRSWQGGSNTASGKSRAVIPPPTHRPAPPRPAAPPPPKQLIIHAGLACWCWLWTVSGYGQCGQAAAGHVFHVHHTTTHW